jgi:DNA-binding NarL/FixJ family response regulator
MKILIVDSDVAFCATLRLNLLAQGFAVDAVSSDNEFVRALNQSRYSAVLLDTTLVSQSGIASLSAMRLGGDATPVVLMSAMQSAAELVQGLDEGADDYVAKPFNVAELCARLRAVVRRAAGVPALLSDDDCAKQVCALSPKMSMVRKLNEVAVALTNRQKEVLHLIARGLQNKHIARELDIAERTVKMHITALLELVGAKNRTQLVVIAGARGLL